MKSGAIPAPPEEKAGPTPDAEELRAGAEARRESLFAREESLRPVHDDRLETAGGRADAAEPDLFADDADLPTFFEAIRPHLRRNQKEPGLAASVEYLAKKFGQTEADLIEALKECGFTIPSGPKDPPDCPGVRWRSFLAEPQPPPSALDQYAGKAAAGVQGRAGQKGGGGGHGGNRRPETGKGGPAERG